METLFEQYTHKAVPHLKTVLGAKNAMEVPQIKKVVVNTGVGKFLKDERAQQSIERDLALITGQKVSPRKAKKSIAGFKIREGMVIGYSVTLRGKRMWDFLTRLIDLALPRTRDFRGISAKHIDRHGNLTFGIREHIVFPEVSLEDLHNIFGLEITIVTNAKNPQRAEMLLREIGFPFMKETADKK